jgi:hypothetical protein
METRWTPDASPTALLVRFFPDVLHADSHAEALTVTEQKLGKAYWGAVAADPEGADAAFSTLATQIGAWRAAWVVSKMRGKTAPATLESGEPVRARLLPERFAVIGYAQEGPDPVGTWWGEEIPDDLPMAPTLVEAGDVDGRGLLDAQGLQWTYDFVAAEAVGMAVRIDLTKLDPAIKTEGFRRLLAIGVRRGEQSAALGELLSAHRYTHGLDFIPQGTPTNSTETAGATMSNEAPDLAAVRAAELDAPPIPPRPDIAADGDLYAGRAADAATVALGLGRGNALDWTTRADLAELTHARAMARALWPATGGHYFDEVMDGIVTAGGRTWLRDWSTAFVRGGALLPTLLVGAQPYGLLPVAELKGRRGVNAPAAGNLMELQNILAELRWDWDLSLAKIPHLDPDATDAPPSGDETDDEIAAVMSQVMGAVPHPTAFRLARVDDMRSTYITQWEWRDFNAGLLCLAVRDANGDAWGDSPNNPAWTLWNELADDLDGATSLFHQQHAVQEFVDGLNTWAIASNVTAAQRADYIAARDYAQSALLDFVLAHSTRTQPIPWLALRTPDVVSTMMGAEDDPRALFALRPFDAPWLPPLIVDQRSEAEYGELRHWLDDVRQGLAFGTPPQHSYSRATSLLRQIVAWSAERAAGTDDGPLLSDGLAVFQDILDGSVADPAGELERLLREGLGPWGYRLDAWYTGIGAWRLENKRAARPLGVQVGGFGWLVDVKPRETATASQGYVLAPSLTHATSAAIMRSGWSAMGEQLDVNLSSDRVRRAHWITEGVRAGQDLGRLLGARFERALQDAGLASRIDDFRQIVLDAEGSPAPANAIVDGLVLARARADAADQTTVESSAETKVNALLASVPTEAARMRAALDGIVADLDAAADASIAQSVFSLAQGNVPEASATLSAAATGEISFPPLRFADTPREAATITHRVVLLVDPKATAVWPEGRASGRAAAAPTLEAWAGGLLGSPGSYRFSVRFDDRETGAALAGPFAVALGEVGLAALDLVFLAPVGEDSGLGRLGSVLTAYAERLRPASVPDDALVTLITDQGDPSVDDLAIACRALRRLLAEARDLDARDLATPGDEATSGFAVGDLDARVGAVRRRLAAGRFFLEAALPAAEGGPARGDIAAAMVGLAGFELAGGLPAGNDPDALLVAGTALLDQIDGRLLALEQRITAEQAEWDSLSELDRVSRLRGRIELLVGRALPLAPQFSAANGAALDDSFGRGRIGSREDATGWLAAAGRVDPGARRLRLAVDMTEAVRNKVAFGFAVGQLPDYPEEGWAAITKPTHDKHGRLSLLTTGVTPRFRDAAAAGLVISSWTEALPQPGQSPGLALHFDAPSARAPQAIMLCSVPDAYDFDAVHAMVDQTLDIARLRMVGPETLQELGQFLPAVYLHGETTAGGVA